LDATHENEELTDEVEELVKCKKLVKNGDCCHGSFRKVRTEVENGGRRKKRNRDLRSKTRSQEDWSFHQAFFNPELLFQNLFLQLKEFVHEERLSCMSVIDWSMDIVHSELWKKVK
jgi:hypothetical protein